MAIGLPEEYIDDSCPKDMEPYIKAREIRFKEQDEIAFLQGVYFCRSIAACLDNETPYPSKPLYSEFGFEKTEEQLTEKEKRERVENLFMRLQVMGGNFNRTHSTNYGGD